MFKAGVEEKMNATLLDRAVKNVIKRKYFTGDHSGSDGHSYEVNGAHLDRILTAVTAMTAAPVSGVEEHAALDALEWVETLLQQTCDTEGEHNEKCRTIRKAMTELKPCPMCRGEAMRYTIEHDSSHENYGGDVIECKKCGLSTKVFFGEKEGIEDAWNTRATDTPTPHPSSGETHWTPKHVACVEKESAPIMEALGITPPPSVGLRVDLGRVREILYCLRRHNVPLSPYANSQIDEALDILDAAGKE